MDQKVAVSSTIAEVHCKFGSGGQQNGPIQREERYDQQPNILTRMRGLFFGLIILMTSLFGCYVIMLFLPLLLFEQHKLWRRCIDKSIAFWLLLPMGLLNYLFRIKFCVTGDPISPSEPALIIMNHRTRLDWLYFWNALYRINPWLLTTEKIALKAALRNIPGSGWAMAANMFVFLERNIESDSERLSEAIDYFSEIGVNYQVLFFPEGTDKSVYTTKKSEEYAAQHGLKPYQYLLQPRMAGVLCILQKMRRSNYIKCVYDVTVAYGDRIVQSELDLGLKGLAPKKVHFNIERIEIGNVPKSDEDIADWLNGLWRKKEEKLRNFYAAPVGWRQFSYHTESNNGLVWPLEESPLSTAFMFYGLCMWLFVFVMWSWHAFILPFIQVCLTGALLVYILIRFTYGGIDRMVYVRWSAYKRKIGLTKLV